MIKVGVARITLGGSGSEAQSSNILWFLLYYFLDLYVLGLFILLTYKKGLIGYLVPLIFLLVSLAISSILNETNLTSHVIYYLRIINPILCVWIYCIYFEPSKVNDSSKIIIIFCSGFLIITVLFGEVSYNRFLNWLPAYIGGVHTTAYFVSILGIWAAVKMISGGKFKVAAFIITITLLLTIFGWGVRSASLLLVSAIFIYLLSLTRPEYRISIIIFFATFTFTLFPFIMTLDIDGFSSGRISMYDYKFEQIANRGLLSQLFGSGSGSDLIETDVWWGVKGAHNDFLTWFIESGLIGLICFVFFLKNFFISLNGKLVKSVFLACLITSLFSNGIIVRPIPFYLFSLFVIYFSSNINKCRNHIE